MSAAETSYSDVIWAHYDNPRQVGTLPEDRYDVGTARVGSVAQGNIIKLQAKINRAEIIEIVRFKAQGSVALIAAAALVTEWLQGKSVAQALAVHNGQIAAALALPPLEIRCAVLAEHAVKAAIADWRAKQAATKMA